MLGKEYLRPTLFFRSELTPEFNSLAWDPLTGVGKLHILI